MTTRENPPRATQGSPERQAASNHEQKALADGRGCETRPTKPDARCLYQSITTSPLTLRSRTDAMPPGQAESVTS